jgi:hypothetical protein
VGIGIRKTEDRERRPRGELLWRLSAQEGAVAELRGDRLKDGRALLRRQVSELQTMQVAVVQAADRQISLSDPDARAMATKRGFS